MFRNSSIHLPRNWTFDLDEFAAFSDPVWAPTKPIILGMSDETNFVYDFTGPLHVYVSGHRFIFLSMLGCLVPLELDGSTFFVYETFGFLIWIQTKCSGGITRCEHGMSQSKPLLGPLIRIIRLDQVLYSGIH